MRDTVPGRSQHGAPARSRAFVAIVSPASAEPSRYGSSSISRRRTGRRATGTADPELRHTKKNIPVASFTIVHNDRIFDKESEGWVDGDPTFVRCSYWRESGENFAESNEEGARLFVVGKLKQNDFTGKDGN